MAQATLQQRNFVLSQARQTGASFDNLPQRLVHGRDFDRAPSARLRIKSREHIVPGITVARLDLHCQPVIAKRFVELSPALIHIADTV